MKKIIIFMLSIVTSISLHAELDWKKVEKTMANMVKSDEFVNNAVDKLKLSGMPKEVMIEHFKEIYKHPEVVSMMVREMKNAGLENSKLDDPLDYGRKFGAELTVTKSLKGMSRLTLEEQRAFFSYMYKWMTIASPLDCKALIVGGSSSSLADANVEMKYFYKFTREELRAYLALIRRALLAEINDFPSSRTINNQQSKLADDAFEQELIKKIKIGEINERTLHAMSDMPNSDPSDVCSAGKFIFKTVRDMKGFTGELMMTKMILSMQ